MCISIVINCHTSPVDYTLGKATIISNTSKTNTLPQISLKTTRITSNVSQTKHIS